MSFQEMKHSINRFEGVIVDPDSLPEDPVVFAAVLDHHLEQWRARQLIWIEVPIERSALIPIAVERGFQFHHSEEKYLMLVRRQQPDAYVPAYATHYIGAGGVVINRNEELLVVSERFRRSSTPYYKLPGGALHQGEHLVDGVIREVLEETGVRTQFEALACFRHWHGYRYGKSDIYFICRLSPLSEAITRHEYEIEECLWMPVGDYLESELVSPFNKQIVQAALDQTGIVPTRVEGYDDPERREFFFPSFLS